MKIVSNAVKVVVALSAIGAFIVQASTSEAACGPSSRQTLWSGISQCPSANPEGRSQGTFGGSSGRTLNANLLKLPARRAVAEGFLSSGTRCCIATDTTRDSTPAPFVCICPGGALASEHQVTTFNQ